MQYVLFLFTEQVNNQSVYFLLLQTGMIFDNNDQFRCEMKMEFKTSVNDYDIVRITLTSEMAFLMGIIGKFVNYL